MILFLSVSTAFAGAREDVEAHLQRALKCIQSGDSDGAIKEFQAVVGTDPTLLDRAYYEDTYTKSYFNIGFLYSQRGMEEEAVQNFRSALAIQPDHPRSLYYLAYNLTSLGEIGQARAYYERAKSLGYFGQDLSGGDVVGQYFDSFSQDAIILEYRLALDPSKTISVLVHGTPSGDETLLRETIAAIEKYAQIFRLELLQKIFVETARYSQDKSLMVEKWVMGGPSDQRPYWIKYDHTPPPDFSGKTMITVSDSELFL
jgi:tetratricopeptide (TPR) repeat protein